MIRAAAFLAASLVFSTSAWAEDKPPEAPAAFARLLCGQWEGPACGGDWNFQANGTFTARHYTPGNNELTGTWSMRWTALPPTFVRTCISSDDPDLVGKTWEVRLIELTGEGLAYQSPDEYPAGHKVHYRRATKTAEQELAALQGTWTPLTYEEAGKAVPDQLQTQHIIKGDKITIVVGGKTQAEGSVVVDATKNPPQLDFQLNSGETHLMIYVRAGNQVIYCGNRDGKTRPREFTSGTAEGGEYLMAWKIEK